MTSINRYKTGNFNTCDSEVLPDGSILSILSCENNKTLYCFRVKDLYKDTEFCFGNRVAVSESLELVLNTLRGL